MNTGFMRLLADRLEGVPWVDVRLAHCTFPTRFQGVDGFFMAADLMRSGGTPEAFEYQGQRLGSVEAWAVQLIQEQGGYRNEDDAWIEPPSDMLVYGVDQLAWQALGLDRPGGFEGEHEGLVLDPHLASALLAPPFLFGCMRGIGPDAAATVLRRCADGMAPQEAWALAAQELRVSRLRKLAGVLETTPHTVIAEWDEPVSDWSWDDLDKLTCFTMLSRYQPSPMPGGDWCGDLAMWACKVYGPDAEIYFGENANVGLMATMMLGLTPAEGAALFEVQVSSTPGEEFDGLEFSGILTPGLTARALRGVADGVFPSFMWDEVAFEEELEDQEQLMEETLEQGMSENGDFSSEQETHWDSIC